MEVNNRPNSRELLKKVEMDELLSKRGSLKIFFGYAAGVGKTYAMLEAAHDLKKNDVDVVIGYVEPHTRKETLELLNGLESLPAKKVRYKGIMLKEFDLNGALERNPEVLIVDELPHTNPPSYRHNKRWQDIDEILDYGISVYTTVNVQHLESLNDVIASITGIFVKETVPDFILDKADQIELIDIAPEHLRNRFDEGKIYSEVNADRAKVNFFTIENLQALREISLRKTADKLNNEVQLSRLSKSDVSIMPTKEKILVCVSSAPSTAKVIRTASRMASSLKTTWLAVYIESQDSKNMDDDERRRLRQNLNLAELLGAKVEIIHGNDIVEQLIRTANYNNITQIIIGRNAKRRNCVLRLNKKDIVDKLIESAKYIEIHVIPTVIESNEKNRMKFSVNKRSLKEKLLFTKKDFIIACIISVLTNTITLPINGLGFAESNILLVYILGILIISVSTKGYGIGVIAAFVNVLLFNFLFTEPKYAFKFDDPRYLVTFPFFILVATITSTLTTRIKEQAEMFSKKEETAQMLYQISRSFINLSGEDNILNIGMKHLCEGLKKNIICYKVENNNLIDNYILKKVDNIKINERDKKIKEREVAYWVLNNKKSAGRGTDTHNGLDIYFLPISNGRKIMGIVGVYCGEDTLDKDDICFVEAVVAQISLALDREELVKEKERNKLEIERERLRSNLLRAISHDLRTPLTGIAGSSNLILKSYDKLDEDIKLELVKSINSDSEWLIRLVENLLSMTRIESGKLEISKKLELVEEIVSESIQHIKNRLENHNLKIDIPEDVLFVNMDGKLIEQVIINLIDNAIKYTPEESDIIIKIFKREKNAVFEIIDNGPGIPKESINFIFDIFYKGNVENADFRRGVGLGLSICKSIILAHGGEIHVKNNKLGGAKFIFTLPIE